MFIRRRAIDDDIPWRLQISPIDHHISRDLQTDATIPPGLVQLQMAVCDLIPGLASRSVIAALTSRLGNSTPDGRVNGVLIVFVMMEVLGISGRMGLRGENHYGRCKANEPVRRYEN